MGGRGVYPPRPLCAMDYSLAPHISYGLVGGRAVLLDLTADRYLRLGASETATLSVLGAGLPPDPSLNIQALLDRGILRVGAGPPIAPVSRSRPVASALECGFAGGGISALEVFGTSVGALLILRAMGLARTIARWRMIKARAIKRSGRLLDDADRSAYVARGFADARTAVPMSRLCVPDNLALARSLWIRGLAADVYFGVQLDPLLAHAWAQTGRLVLSDPLNIAADYTPVFRL